MLTLPGPRPSLILLGVALLACASTASAQSEDFAAITGCTAPASLAGVTTEVPSTSTAGVCIADRAFTPADIVVAAGDTVEWANADGESHTVTAADGSFDSGVMLEGTTFSQVFEAPGTYDYACAIHPGMRGSVTVTEPNVAPTASPSPVALAPASVPAELQVSIVDLAYDPAVVEVPTGSTVRWTNLDPVVHTVTAREASFNSGVLKTGDEFTLTFDEPGTYDYFCAIHPLQGGQVVVTDPGG